MRFVATVDGVAAVVIALVAQQRDPIIDMHMHALAADAQGPPPLGMCTPFAEYPEWNPLTRYGDLFLLIFKKPPCADPIWSPTTDEELMKQTIAIAERWNIIGVLSGPAPARGGLGKGEPTPVHSGIDLPAWRAEHALTGGASGDAHDRGTPRFR
jgi:uncharacterized protein